MDISAIALQGMDQAQTQLSDAATKIASAGASSAGSNVEVVDLSTEMVALLAAKNDFSVNLKVLETADQIGQQLIDLKA